MQFPLCVLHCTLRKKTVGEKRKAGVIYGLFPFFLLMRLFLQICMAADFVLRKCR
jgi:hypothetical protein